jgi:hypothetical protein
MTYMLDLAVSESTTSKYIAYQKRLGDLGVAIGAVVKSSPA